VTQLDSTRQVAPLISTDFLLAAVTELPSRHHDGVASARWVTARRGRSAPSTARPAGLSTAARTSSSSRGA